MTIVTRKMLQPAVYPLSEGSLCFTSARASSLSLLGWSSLLRSFDLYPFSFSLYLSLHSGVRCGLQWSCSASNSQARAFAELTVPLLAQSLKRVTMTTCFYFWLVVSLYCCFFLSVVPCSYFCYAPCCVPSQEWH